MTKHLPMIALVFAFALASSVIVRTQEKPAPPAPKAALAAVTPLKVSVVVSRFQGEKKLSSLPYTLSVNAGSRGTLRMGAKVPVMMMMTANMPKVKTVFRVKKGAYAADDPDLWKEIKSVDGLMIIAIGH